TAMENVIGGDGNDTILGGAPANVLVGGPGLDSLDGEAANDILDGGGRGGVARHRVLDGCAAADVLAGGAGTDGVTYAGRTAPVHVTIDGLDNDGEAGEGETIRTDVQHGTAGARH